MSIPSDFISDRLRLSWNDVLWGYERQMLGWSAVVDLAQARLGAGSDDSLEIELAGLQKSDADQVGEILRRLARKEGVPVAGLSKRVWLYLMLLWLFENRANVADPLGEIELIYADFEYPSELKSLVRYMPVTDGYDPALHSKAENEERLFQLWQKYLLDTERSLRASSIAML
jgi:hypothetical protein